MFSITLEAYTPDNNYLLLTFDGELSIQTIFKYAPRISITIQQNKCYRIVEDYRLATLKMNANDYSKVQNFQIKNLEKIGIRFTRLKRAMVIDENNISPDDLNFYKMLSINLGQNLSVFSDMYQAIKWLMEDESQSS
jgi:hypothetical protein